MKNKRVKLIESSDSESPVPLNEIKRKKKRVAGVDDATLRRTEKVVNLSF